MRHPYAQRCRPALGRLLHAVGLDVVYEQAEGNRLWYRRDGTPVEVLDFVGGYGATLFGHNHPELVDTLRSVLSRNVPNLVQGSARDGAARLAEALTHRVEDRVVILTNSGAETVEAALKHAYLQRPAPVFWAVEGAYHGKTLGALQLTSAHRGPFEGLGPTVRFLDPWDPTDWEAAERETGDVSAAFVEPILGEGGIRPLPDAFVRWLDTVCDESGIPLVADEIQTGMGRTGTFLALEQYGLDPDYVCLSKALGGGLTKIGALLVKQELFVDEFSVLHTSTFAEDELSSQVALKALALLDRDRLPERCAKMGRYLTERLEQVRRQYPDQLKEVRGRGLMLGVELRDVSQSKSNALRLLAKEGYVGAFAAGYLLHRHGIRVAPALSQSATLRVEPSAYVTEEEGDRLVSAVSALCSALRRLDLPHLTGHLVGFGSETRVDNRGVLQPRREPAMTDRRVAFVGHFIEAEHLLLWDPAFASFPRARLEQFVERTARVLGPACYDETNVRSGTGAEVHLSFIGLYATSHQIEAAMRAREYGWILDNVERAVGLAKEKGCQVVGLGGYTSILTGNCLRVRTNGIALTSGNALTVGAGITALRTAAHSTGIRLGEATLGIVGAGGNIARAYAEILSREVARLVLIVRDRTLDRHRPWVRSLQQENPGGCIALHDRVDAIRECDLIVSATNSAVPLLYPEHLAERPVVICDLSTPGDVAPSVIETRRDVVLLQGGIVRLPRNDDFVIDGIPLPKGHSFACMAETLLMGLEGLSTHGSYGRVTAADVTRALALADKHGFEMGCLQTEKSF